MRNISDKAKGFYLFILIVFIIVFGLFWLDYIGLYDLKSQIFSKIKGEEQSVLLADGDEPSLVLQEEFEKNKERFLERVEELNKREVLLIESEKSLEAEKEKLEEMKKGLELEKKKFSDEKKKYSGYLKNIKNLAKKIEGMPPEESVKIMINWEDPLIIDVLREMDLIAEESGKASITSYLITLMPKEKASRIMYLMTQL
jgi:flagellar protein FlbB